jgi:hypothetical protein
VLSFWLRDYDRYSGGHVQGTFHTVTHTFLGKVVNRARYVLEIEKRNNELGDKERKKGTRYGFGVGGDCCHIYASATAPFTVSIPLMAPIPVLSSQQSIKAAAP